MPLCKHIAGTNNVLNEHWKRKYVVCPVTVHIGLGFISWHLTAGHPSLAWKYQMLHYQNNSDFSLIFFAWLPITLWSNYECHGNLPSHMRYAHRCILVEESHKILKSTYREKHNVLMYHNFIGIVTGNIFKLFDFYGFFFGLDLL